MPKKKVSKKRPPKPAVDRQLAELRHAVIDLSRVLHRSLFEECGKLRHSIECLEAMLREATSVNGLLEEICRLRSVVAGKSINWFTCDGCGSKFVERKHLDAHYAQTATQFKRNVVVGNLIYSVLLGMSVPDVSGKAIANLEVESLRHTAPTFHGDTIYGQTVVLDKRESSSKPDRGVVTVETKGFNQDGTMVCVFRRRVMVPKKEFAGPELPSFPEIRE